MSLYSTDWLASNPLFYNTKTLKVSRNVNDVIDWPNLEIDPEGFNNYLDFGFSVYRQTPVKNVKFLGPNEDLSTDNGILKITTRADPALRLFDKPIMDEEEVISLIKRRVHQWEESTKGDIILPLSGGYDSRMLASMIKDKSRVKAYTYGVSYPQKKSFEVVYAKKIADILGISWQQIALSSFNKKINEWIDLYGCSTHAHGMYHMEFYDAFKDSISPDATWVSGIFGDAWAGKVPTINTEGFNSTFLSKLSYTHGMTVDPAHSLLAADYALREHYWQENKEFLKDARFQMINLARHKLILISYIMRLPHELGFNSWTPFLDEEVVLAMLSIKPERRRERVWQTDYFTKQGLNIENMGLRCNYDNNLNIQNIVTSPLKPLNTTLLKELLEPAYIEKINKIISSAPQALRKSRFKNRLLHIPKVGGALRRLGHSDSYHLGNEQAQAYNQYLVLKPIEQLLERRNNS